ncbi:MAG: Trm112 family protein [Holosporales bacterium]|jgi:uncharacterized protein YbaR (Trm112 family)|nr:Trm112 family protein [Holosporales bacterium]
MDQPLPFDLALLDWIVCPVTKTPLEYDAVRQELMSKAAKLAYPIRAGIPILLPEEARIIETDSGSSYNL